MNLSRFIQHVFFVTAWHWKFSLMFSNIATDKIENKMRDHTAMPSTKDVAKLSLFAIDIQKHQHLLVWDNSADGACRFDTGTRPVMRRLLLDRLTRKVAPDSVRR